MSETHNRLKLVLLKKSVEAQFMRKMLRNVSEKAFIKIYFRKGTMPQQFQYGLSQLTDLLFRLMPVIRITVSTGNAIPSQMCLQQLMLKVFT